MAPHRLSNLLIIGYEDDLRGRIYRLIQSMDASIPALPPSAMYDNWILDESYRKMVAAIDMFLFKFPNHECAAFRMCTIRSRFKDCAGLLSLGFMSSLLNLETDSVFLNWVFTEKIAEELIKMMIKGNEITNPGSYFPYQSDMGVVKKTYYSTTVNPHTYFVIHAAVTLLSSNRAKNARHLTEYNVTNNVVNAKIIAYASASCFSLTKAFLERDTTLPDEIDLEDEEPELSPSVANGLAWFVFMRSRKFKTTKKMDEFVNKAKAAIGEVRAGTIGEYVKQHF